MKRCIDVVIDFYVYNVFEFYLQLRGAFLWSLRSAMSFLSFDCVDGLYSGCGMIFSIGMVTNFSLQSSPPPDTGMQSGSVVLSYSPSRTFTLKS